jgi:hypothetical protein
MMQRDIDSVHGDEPLLEAEYQERLEQYENDHADDWKGEVNEDIR